jgi:uncharacterized protein (TIGR02117 family)
LQLKGIVTAILTRRVFFISALLFCMLACSAPKGERTVRAASAAATRVFVVHNEWHAAIVAKTADIATAVLPELAHFSGAAYVELGWGDADFFPAPEGGVWLVLKAAFWSNGSVVHVVGFSSPVKDTYRGAEIIEINLSAEEFQKLIAFVSASIKRDLPGQAAEARPGLFPHSRFYAAKGKFSILRTCNTWVAEAFSAAGLPISPGYTFTAGMLARQLKQLATVK